VIWIQFDALMNCAVDVDEKHLSLAGGERELVLFWQPENEEHIRLPLFGYRDG
jgi:hypothetical protein